MNSHPTCWPGRLLLLAGALTGCGSPLQAQVTSVVVGITPTCPYGYPGCYPGAREALSELPGVKAASSVPDVYNCTAEVVLNHGGLPDVARWAKEFRKRVGNTHHFRGVEITVLASVESKDGRLVLKADGIDEPVRLAPLEHKLQWNFKKRATRQPEPDEASAYRDLEARQQAKAEASRVELTGPLRKSGGGTVLEVREFFFIPNPGDKTEPKAAPGSP